MDEIANSTSNVNCLDEENRRYSGKKSYPTIRELIEERAALRMQAARAEREQPLTPPPSRRQRAKRSARTTERSTTPQASGLDLTGLRRTNIEALYPHLPARTRCADDYHDGQSMLPKHLAIHHEHIGFNRHASVDWMLFDYDGSDLRDALEGSNLDMPNFIVGNRENGKGHFGYRLAKPVLRFDSSRRHPIEYAAGIQRGFMRRIGTDPRFNGTLLKNPAHLKWQVQWFSTAPFSLEQLGRDLDKSEMAAAAKLALEIGEGRNVGIFETLRTSGYKIVRQYWGNYDGFRAHMLGDAIEINSRFQEPLSDAEIRSIVKSVCNWIWARFDQQSFSDRQRRVANIRWAGHVAASIAEPWTEFGISRATYYRRKKANQLATS